MHCWEGFNPQFMFIAIAGVLTWGGRTVCCCSHLRVVMIIARKLTVLVDSREDWSCRD
jgi:hypothetical protein